MLGFFDIRFIIATSTTTAIALSQSIQTANFVNDLSKNVTFALGTQDIDSKLEQKLNALYEVVKYLGIQGLKVRSHLECHVEYQ